MTKLLPLSILLAAGLVQIPQPVLSAGSPANAAETGFNKLCEEFIAGYLAWRPQIGTTLGLHQYDGKLTDYSRASLDAELARLKRFDQQLTALDAKSLGPQAYYDLRILQAAIKNEIFQFEDVEGFRKNPMTYAGVLDLNIYIKRNFAPLEERVRSIIAIGMVFRSTSAPPELPGLMAASVCNRLVYSRASCRPPIACSPCAPRACSCAPG